MTNEEATSEQLAQIATLVAASEQRVVLWLLSAVWTDALVGGLDVGRLLERNAQTLRSHGWSSFLDDCVSVEAHETQLKLVLS